MSPKITVAAIRHYFRALNLKIEAEERIDEDEMDRQVDEAIKNKKPLDFAVLSDEQREALVAKALAKDPEYLAFRDELGKLLQLGPDDLNPLDLTFDNKWKSKDDPRRHAWLRAVDLTSRLSS